MPIANCFIRGELPADSEIEGVTALWSEESSVGEEHLTINVIAGTRQDGAAYKLMGVLYLPSSWSVEQVRRLQLGLVRSLCRRFALPPAEVHVITSIVGSGHVVESGETQEW